MKETVRVADTCQARPSLVWQVPTMACSFLIWQVSIIAFLMWQVSIIASNGYDERVASLTGLYGAGVYQAGHRPTHSAPSMTFHGLP